MFNIFTSALLFVSVTGKKGIQLNVCAVLSAICLYFLGLMFKLPKFHWKTISELHRTVVHNALWYS